MARPSDEDIKAGYMETLMAVAVHHIERPRAEIPWAHPGDVGIWPGDIDTMLRRISSWEHDNIDYVVYLVPADEYRPLGELGIRGPEELDWEEFPATPEEITTVRAAMSRAEDEKGGSSE